MKTNVADTRGEMDKEIYLSACEQSTFIYLSARVQCALLYLSAGPPDCPPDSGGKCSITLVFWEYAPQSSSSNNQVKSGLALGRSAGK